MLVLSACVSLGRLRRPSHRGGRPTGSRLLPRVTPGRLLATDVGCTRIDEPPRKRVAPRAPKRRNLSHSSCESMRLSRLRNAAALASSAPNWLCNYWSRRTASSKRHDDEETALPSLTVASETADGPSCGLGSTSTEAVSGTCTASAN